MDPVDKKRLRFEIYSRLTPDVIPSFWRYTNNTVVLAHVIPAKLEEVQCRYILTVNEFYYVRLQMKENFIMLQKLVNQEATKPKNKPKNQQQQQEGKRKRNRRFRLGSSSYRHVDEHSTAKAKRSSRTSCLQTLTARHPDSSPNAEDGKNEGATVPHTDAKRPEVRRIESSDLCSVCYDVPNDVVLPCAHAFCESCITDWNVKSNTCPICRKDLDEVEKDDIWVLTNEMDEDFIQMAKDQIKIIFQYISKKPELKRER